MIFVFKFVEIISDDIFDFISVNLVIVEFSSGNISIVFKFVEIVSDTLFDFISVEILSDFIIDDWIIDWKLVEIFSYEIVKSELFSFEVFSSEGIDVYNIFKDEIVLEIVVNDILSVRYSFKLFDEDIESIRDLLFTTKLSVINICSTEKGLLLETSEIALEENSSFPHFFAIL
jgi:hypothetical protein